MTEYTQDGYKAYCENRSRLTPGRVMLNEVLRVTRCQTSRKKTTRDTYHLCVRHTLVCPFEMH